MLMSRKLMVQVLALVTALVHALGPGGRRWSRRRWRRWLMPPRVMALVSRLLWRLSCPLSWLLVTLARLLTPKLALMLVLLVRVLGWANHLRVR